MGKWAEYPQHRVWLSHKRGSVVSTHPYLVICTLITHNKNVAARKPTLWTLRKVSTRTSLSMPRRLPGQTIFASCGFSVQGIISLYIYPPETECVGTDQSARTAQTDLGRYITQRLWCWFSRGTAQMYYYVMLTILIDPFLEKFISITVLFRFIGLKSCQF